MQSDDMGMNMDRHSKPGIAVKNGRGIASEKKKSKSLWRERGRAKKRIVYSCFFIKGTEVWVGVFFFFFFF